MAKQGKILSFSQAWKTSEQARHRSASTSRARSTAHSARPDRSKKAQEPSRSLRSKQTARSTSSRVSLFDLGYQEDLYQDEEETLRDEEESSRGRSQMKREDRRKKRSKAKASKMYTRQFEGADAAASENAPRAALYKGQMGAKQKKATRMQSASRGLSLPSLAGSGAIRDTATNLVSTSTVSPLSIKVLTGFVCVLLVCFFLYTPAQQYYHSQRENARLETEYVAVQNRNDALDVQNDILVSDAGLEDAVRQRFGYIKANEELGVVVGLSEGATDSLRGSSEIEANVLSSSVKAPEEWYTPFLDALFGVE